jgi:3-isopropylmalate/(R)-2-methylmalate dehydratase small subunit
VNISGKVLVLGDDVSSDLIYPGRYLTVSDRTEQARHALEGLGEDWPDRIRGYTVLGAGWNLGCGSSREQAATALLAAGIRLVVARSLSRLFLRNCINNGLPVIESDALAAALAEGVLLSADLTGGTARVDERTFHFEPLPEGLLAIVRDGGLLARLRRTVQERARS